MNFFKSEHNSITNRRKHYQRERITQGASRFSGIDPAKIRQKLQANPPSRNQIDRVLYFDLED